jgi:hypothetical protein
MELTDAELELLIAAVDSHRYWQVAEESQRSEGEVIVEEGDENWDEFYACATVELKLEKERARRDIVRMGDH